MLAFLAVFIPSAAASGLIAIWHLSRAHQLNYAEECLADEMEPVAVVPVAAVPMIAPKRRARKSKVSVDRGLTGYLAA